MKDFLRYLPLIAVAGFIGYVFFKELVILAIIILLIIFRGEVLGLYVLAQIVAVVVGIPYLFFTDSQIRNSMLTLAVFFGGIFLLVHLLTKNEKGKEDTKIDSSQVKSEQVPRIEKNNLSEFYKIDELQSRLEKWLITVENARAENKWKYGRDYERYVGYLFEREEVSVIYNGATKGSSDGGIDLFCFKDGIVYPIQCKRWKKKVDEEEIDKFVRAVAIFKRNRSFYDF
ncbi:MAG: restriction endonuclease [Quinella sp. 3Q1]|nr:restriction endonuclease [Quinella sp. 3Q1]MBR6888390.1 restriction endonuclease [Selenomonadaceae bacterium]